MTPSPTSTTTESDVEAPYNHLVLTELELEARWSAITKLDQLQRPPHITAELDAVFDVRICYGCGCTDDNACWPPCSWIDVDQCSACDGKPRHVELLGHHLQAAAAENA